MPTTSPGPTWLSSNGSRHSSTRIGSPHLRGVAAASTYSQRGVMTATPNEKWLGLTMNTRKMSLSKDLKL